MKNRFASVILFLLAIPTPALAQESRPRTPRAITIDDFFQIRDVSQPEISPDGQWIAYAVRRSEERRVGKECRTWWSPEHLKKISSKSVAASAIVPAMRLAHLRRRLTNIPAIAKSTRGLCIWSRIQCNRPLTLVGCWECAQRSR